MKRLIRRIETVKLAHNLASGAVLAVLVKVPDRYWVVCSGVAGGLQAVSVPQVLVLVQLPQVERKLEWQCYPV